MPESLTPEWSVVIGEEFRKRRERLNMTQGELAEEAGIKSRDTVGAIEAGKGSGRSRAKLHQALQRLEAEAALPALHQDRPSEPAANVAAPNIIEFDITGDFGVHIVVKGPVVDADLLREQAAQLIREIRATKGNNADSAE